MAFPPPTFFSPQGKKLWNVAGKGGGEDTHTRICAQEEGSIRGVKSIKRRRKVTDVAGVVFWKKTFLPLGHDDRTQIRSRVSMVTHRDGWARVSGIIMHSCDAENGWSRACDARTYTLLHVRRVIIGTFNNFSLFFAPPFCILSPPSIFLPCFFSLLGFRNCFRFLSRVEFFLFPFFFFFFSPKFVLRRVSVSTRGRVWFNGYGEFVGEWGKLDWMGLGAI